MVNNPENWHFTAPGIDVVSARDYLTNPSYAQVRGVRVFNLCRSYRYMSLGYYVSLLAEARGHRPLPTINTVRDIRMPAIVQVAAEDLDKLVQRDLASLQSKRFTLSIYFGRNMAKRYARLCTRLFNLFPAPLLRAQFVRREKWELTSLYTIASSDVPQSHRAFVEEAATDFFARPASSRTRRRTFDYDLAILVDPDDANPPSDKVALGRFERAAETQGMKPTFITRDDYGRLAQFDALFIRETTYVNHHTYRFASRAAAEGLVVIDDPVSIVRCTNKVYLAELLARHRIRTPRTTIVHDGNLEQVATTLRFPSILKRPDSSFSQGVVKVEDTKEFMAQATSFLNTSDLIIVQEFLPTEFDWRVGILDRRPIFVCRYWMARGHWQIIQWAEDGIDGHGGKWDTLAIEDAPPKVLRAALRAADPIGDGLYGVDLKEVGERVYVIEVNDNPSIDSDVEDRVLKKGLYEQIMSVFRKRLETPVKNGRAK